MVSCKIPFLSGVLGPDWSRRPQGPPRSCAPWYAHGFRRRAGSKWPFAPLRRVMTLHSVLFPTAHNRGQAPDAGVEDFSRDLYLDQIVDTNAGAWPDYALENNPLFREAVELYGDAGAREGKSTPRARL